MIGHKFGNYWTEDKLGIIKEYLEFYTIALQNKPWNLVYIDAFAGSGSRVEEVVGAPLLDIPDEKITHKGSARISLEISKPFDQYIFIEENKQRYNELVELTLEFPELNTECHHGDANVVLKDITQNINWLSNRAVLFLDPYNLSVEPDTLNAIQSSKAIDVWFLFAISDFYRQAARDYDAIEQHKIERLNRIFGTSEWQQALYKEKEPEPGGQSSFTFDTEPDETAKKLTRESDVRIMENWVRQWLNGIFPSVAKPLRLPRVGAPLFSLFFCVSNPSGNAIGLAMKVANHILKP